MTQPPTPDSDSRPGIARATMFGFVAEAMIFPAGLITSAFLTRYLGVSGYGQLSLIYAVVSPVSWLVSTTLAGRVGVALLTNPGNWQAMAATLLKANILLGLCVMVGFAAAVPVLSAGLGRPGLAPFLWAGAVEIALLPVIRIHRDALIAAGRYSSPAYVTFAFQLARLALILGLVWAGLGVLGAVLANVGARIVELTACLAWVRLPIRGAVRGWLGPVKAQVGGLFAYTVCFQLFNRADLLMLGFLGATGDELGHYGAAQNLAQALGMLAVVLSPLVIAAIRRAESAGADAEAAALKSGTARLALTVWAMAGPVAAGATRLVVLLFGESFAPSGIILGWLGVSAGAGLVLSVLVAHQIAAGRYSQPLVAAVPMLLVAIGLQAVLIPRYGALGAAWATAAATILAAMIAQGFEGSEYLAARGFDLVRMATAGTAGFFGTLVAARAGLPSPMDMAAGGLVTGAVLLAVRLASVQDLRRLSAQILSSAKPAGTP